MQREETARPFGFWMATALVVGGMVGAGIFVMPAQLAPFGPAGVVAWLFAGVGTMVIAWVLSCLTAARPDATGLIAICAEAMGPMAGVVIGWSYWVATCAANAILSITTVRYLSVFVPALRASSLWQALAATAVLALITALNLNGAKTSGWFQLLTTALKLMPLIAVALILAGLAASGGSAFSPQGRPAFDAAQITPALTLVFFALVGFEGAGVVAERVKDPARNVVRAMLAGLGVTAVIYVIVCTGIVYALPQADVAASGAPIAFFVERYVGAWAGMAVAAFAIIATVGCLNGWVLVQGEVPLGMARDRLLPAWFGRRNSKDVAVRGLVLSSVFSAALILSNAQRDTAGLLDFMLRLTSITAIGIYVGACIAALRFGVARGAAIVSLLFCGWLCVGAGFEADAWSVALMATAVPLYWLRPKDKAVTEPALG